MGVEGTLGLWGADVCRLLLRNHFWKPSCFVQWLLQVLQFISYGHMQSFQLDSCQCSYGAVELYSSSVVLIFKLLFGARIILIFNLKLVLEQILTENCFFLFVTCQINRQDFSSSFVYFFLLFTAFFMISCKLVTLCNLIYINSPL